MERSFGIFETVRVENGKAIFVNYHFRRLKKSSKLLKIPLSLSLEEFKKRIEESADYEVSLVRLTLYKNGNYNIYSRPCQKKTSVTLIPVNSIKRYYSPISLHKTIDIMDSIYAIEEARKLGGDEALLFDINGFISETAFANIFFVKDGVFFTPSLKTGCLPGTRREFILNLLKEMDIPIFEGFYSLEDLISADEVFITSARYDVAQVKRVGKVELKTPAGKSWGKRILDIIQSFI
ncbi:aminotransferase class IV [Desulfurobacterium thermolithotrophum DSM 11699]|uniref:Aminotransferase class IV n=1 Tax=Desulfurobacterium thermolithotrophum (strain DSM 11699 / BSA) TaxID=868864 RepID=F0S3D8_DESTD|nr:aminotransferase class IV [Desulfurobacterium thermolithotrophum]ADY73360.1 aminotransferase class IV [Desulfurobacterium thermolithotrophum DSM 11699]